MEISFSKDLEGKLTRLALQQGRDAKELVVEAVERMVGYDAWFMGEVEKGLRQIETGQTFSHEEVGINLKKYMTGKLPAA